MRVFPGWVDFGHGNGYGERWYRFVADFCGFIFYRCCHTKHLFVGCCHAFICVCCFVSLGDVVGSSFGDLGAVGDFASAICRITDDRRDEDDGNDCITLCRVLSASLD